MSKFQMMLWPVFTLIMFGVALFFNYTASTGLVSDLDVGEVSDEFALEITPAGWTFTIWAFIYLWQFLWIAFVLFLTARREMDSVVFGRWFFFAFNAANVFNALWIVVWVNEHIVWAAAFLLSITASLIAASFIAHRYLYRASSTVVDSNYGAAGSAATTATMATADSSSAPQWLVASRPALFALVANGIPFYATWCVVASHLNLGIVICYEFGMAASSTSFLMLSVLSLVILFYWFLDFYRLRAHLQYTYSPYIVLIVAFSGILTDGGLDTEERPSSPFVLALLIVAVLGTVAKVIMGISMRNTPSPKILESV